MMDVGASSGPMVGVNDQIPEIHVVEANPFSSDQKSHPGKDPKKLKRMMDYRVYSRKYKPKKAQYVVELEKRARTLETEVALLRLQVEALQNQKLSLEIEHQALKVQIVLLEKDRLIKEEEIEKNKVEVNKLHGFLSRQLQAQRQMRVMINLSSTTMHSTSSSNSIPLSGLGQMVSAKSVQDPNTEKLARQGLTCQVKSEPEA